MAGCPEFNSRRPGGNANFCASSETPPSPVNGRFLLAAAEASAQSVRSIRCRNGGYVGKVWCCKVNSAQCAAEQPPPQAGKAGLALILWRPAFALRGRPSAKKSAVVAPLRRTKAFVARVTSQVFDAAPGPAHRPQRGLITEASGQAAPGEIRRREFRQRAERRIASRRERGSDHGRHRSDSVAFSRSVDLIGLRYQFGLGHELRLGWRCPKRHNGIHRKTYNRHGRESHHCPSQIASRCAVARHWPHCVPVGPSNRLGQRFIGRINAERQRRVHVRALR